MAIYKTILMLISISLLYSCLDTRQEPGKTQAKASLNPDSQSTKDSLRFAYTGNMGVLIEYGNETVLFDGLHEPYKPAYLYPPDSMVQELISGQFAGFGSIDACLFSHAHRDHFSGRYAATYLEQNPDGLMIGAAQVASKVKPEQADRIHEVSYSGEVDTIQQGDIRILATRCDHVNPGRHGSVQNVAYLVTLRGFRILHVGDTHWELAVPAFDRLKLQTHPPDIAILPYWMLLEKRSTVLLEKHINPGLLLATHVPPDFSKTEADKLRKQFPGIQVLTSLGHRNSLPQP